MDSNKNLFVPDGGVSRADGASGSGLTNGGGEAGVSDALTGRVDARAGDGAGGMSLDGSAATAILSASEPSSACGSVVVTGQPCITTFTITNIGQQVSGPITVTSDSSNFVVESGGGAVNCVSGTTILAPGVSCTVRVSFSPQRPVASKGTVAFFATPGNSGSVSLSGTGVCPSDAPDNGTNTCVPVAGVAWTKTSYLTPSPWQNLAALHVAASSDGAKLVAAEEWGSTEFNAGYIHTSVDFGTTWTRTSAPQGRWVSVASSSDGTKLVAASSIPGVSTVGEIYTSTDSGKIWKRSSAPNPTGYGWISLASSSDGTRLVAGGGGFIYASADSGATWTQTDSPSSSIWTVASSSDGTRLVAGGDTGVYTSADSGASWIKTSASLTSAYKHVASSADGTKLVAADGGGDNIYTSGDSGATWTQTSAPSAEGWSAVASSSDGTRLVAAGFHVYTSSDSGASWKQTRAPGLTLGG